MKTYDCVIVGAGIAGLTCGAELASRGVDVCLLEREPFIGGRARGEMIEGFSVDWGIHGLHHGRKGLAAGILKELGLKSPEILIVGDPLIYYDGKMQPMPIRPASIFGNTMLATRDRITLGYLVAKTFFLNPDKYDNLTMQDYIDRHRVRSKEVRDCFRLMAMMFASNPDPGQVSAGESFRILRRGFKSRGEVGYPQGGWLALNEALKQKIEENGEVRLGAAVRGLESDSDGAVVLHLSGAGDIRGKTCVLAIPLWNSIKLLDRNRLSPRETNFIDNLQPTVGVTIDFGLVEPVTDISGVITTVDPPTMGYFTSNFDPSTAPRGKQLGTWLRTLTPGDLNVAGAGKALIQETRDLIESIFPGVWAKAQWVRPLVIRDVDGCLLKPGQLKGNRPGPGIGDYKNIFVAGDTCRGDGNGGDIAFHSAIDAAKAVRDCLKN